MDATIDVTGGDDMVKVRVLFTADLTGKPMVVDTHGAVFDDREVAERFAMDAASAARTLGMHVSETWTKR